MAPPGPGAGQKAGWARVRCPGSCGELVQGVLEGIPFLVTCPVDLYSTVTVRVGPGPRLVKVYPATKEKVRRAVERTIAYLGLPSLQVEVEVTSQIPDGKGMASSTADIAAAVLATAEACQVRLELDEIGRLALGVEPTDGTFLPGIAVFDHLGGRVMDTIGLPPPLRILVLDLGGEVDTVSFNQRTDLWPAYLARAETTARALELVRRGLRQGDPGLLARGATISALAHQATLPKEGLAEILDCCRVFGALGLNVAHSGTVVGLIFSDRDSRPDLAKAAASLTGRFPQIQQTRALRLVSGGLEVVARG